MTPYSCSTSGVVAFCNGMIWIDEHDFCRLRHIGKPDQNIRAHHIQDMARASREICGDKKLKHILDLRGVKYTMSPDGRENICGNEDLNSCRAAVAAIVDSTVVRSVIEKLIEVNKPPYPYRIFDTEKEAVDWLNSL